VPPTPVIVTEVILALNVDEPVEVFVISVIKPLSDATGPEKVVLAIVENLRVIALPRIVSITSARSVDTSKKFLDVP
jgi:hypothetical protein